MDWREFIGTCVGKLSCLITLNLACKFFARKIDKRATPAGNLSLLSLCFLSAAPLPEFEEEYEHKLDNMAMSYIDEVVASVIATIQQWGWPVVFSLIAIYMLQPQINQFKNWLSLKRANDPDRVRVLNEERQRVRLQQQLDLKRRVQSN